MSKFAPMFLLFILISLGCVGYHPQSVDVEPLDPPTEASTSYHPNGLSEAGINASIATNNCLNAPMEFYWAYTDGPWWSAPKGILTMVPRFTMRLTTCITQHVLNGPLPFTFLSYGANGKAIPFAGTYFGTPRITFNTTSNMIRCGHAKKLDAYVPMIGVFPVIHPGSSWAKWEKIFGCVDGKKKYIVGDPRISHIKNRKQWLEARKNLNEKRDRKEFIAQR